MGHFTQLSPSELLRLHCYHSYCYANLLLDYEPTFHINTIRWQPV